LSGVNDPPLDPISAWRELPAEVQERIGATAIAFALGSAGATVRSTWFEAAEAEAQAMLIDLVGEYVLEDNKPLPYPLLGPIGIRQFRVCGWTEHHRRSERRHWIADHLCSECAPHTVSDQP
jgi:hypothetical protein